MWPDKIEIQFVWTEKMWIQNVWIKENGIKTVLTEKIQIQKKKRSKNLY